MSKTKDGIKDWNKWSVILNSFLTLIIIVLTLWNLSLINESNNYNIPEQPVLVGSLDRDGSFPLGEVNLTLKIINNFDYAINAQPSVIDVTYEGDTTRTNHMIPELPEIIVKQKGEVSVDFSGEFNKKGRWGIFIRTYYKYSSGEDLSKSDYEDFTLRLNIE